MMRILAGVVLIAWPVYASTTIVVRPSSTTPNSGDAYLRAAAPTTNFGGAGALVVAGSSAANTKGEFASVLKFDLSVATSALDTAYGAGNWTVESILLELTVVVPNNVNFNANAAGTLSVDWLATDSWIESGASSITWSGLPALLSGGSQSMGVLAFDGGLGTTQKALTGNVGFMTDLTSGGIATIYLNAASDPNLSLTMNSRNFGTPETRPALIITASPEPGRTMLLLLGTTLMSLRRRRKGAS
jgi:hypothetical protein